ncbi:MAG TPA: dipeptidyl peptidase 3 [Bacteroides mediterraneensis]|uniref:dipeptidyl-peptidase 3 family protein n=1 Tax=Bacteroides mediterraneensis TaxID=1841856 RepID=UPI0026E9A1FB|nr:dihydrofolate reductase [Bacteroides mediterraneensis]HJH63302.1 dipeptidyl peptidase 3 [Bacteroides mediterraneensis]
MNAQGNFNYIVEQFADLQLLRYRVTGFENLSLQQKELVYYLSQAALEGRDILFDQNGKYNLRIRKLLEVVYTTYTGDKEDAEFQGLEVYLKRVWFSSGIYHHYACDKFVPSFSPDFLRKWIEKADATQLPLKEGESVQEMCDTLFPVIFNPQVMPKRVNQADGEDLVMTSAANYYEGVTQKEAEAFYSILKIPGDPHPVMYGMNSRLVKKDGIFREEVWKVGGMYGEAIEKIIAWLEKAEAVAESEAQREVIRLLVDFYRTGDLKTFDAYSIAWLKDTASKVDFVNGFIESYGDPLGMKASWESIVNFKDEEATRRTEIISQNAQWFEDHSPVALAFKKEVVTGVSAKVITAAMLGGDLYPSSAIGINLPNSNWIRSRHGSKSVTIGNLTDAYNKAAKGNGFREEFVYSQTERDLLEKYADITSELHTDLHECVGHGSGRLIPGVDPDALKAYGSTIEEARADLFGLYYLADKKLVELGLTPDEEAYKAEYYAYMMNGLLTQMVRIEPGRDLEEAHMRNRQLIARWALEYGKSMNVVELVQKEGKTYVKVNDYLQLRGLFGMLLSKIQRIKSEGNYEAARALVEKYGVKLDASLHEEVLARYRALHLAPYKGFVNPVYRPEYDAEGRIVDVKVDYTEGYTEQMLRYGRDYSNLKI